MLEPTPKNVPPSPLPPPNRPIPLELIRLIARKGPLSLAGKIKQLGRCAKSLLLPADLSYIVAAEWCFIVLDKWCSWNPGQSALLPDQIWIIPGQIAVPAVQLILRWEPVVADAHEEILEFAIANGSVDLIHDLWQAVPRVGVPKIEEDRLNKALIRALQNGVQEDHFITLVECLRSGQYTVPAAVHPYQWYKLMTLTLEMSFSRALKAVIQHFDIPLIAQYTNMGDLYDWRLAVGKYCDPDMLQLLMGKGFPLGFAIRGMLAASSTELLGHALSRGLNVTDRDRNNYLPGKYLTEASDTDEADIWNGNILQCAAEADNMKAMKLLVDAGAPVKASYPEGLDILTCRVVPSDEFTERRECTIENLSEMVTYLVSKGYRVTDKDLAAVLDHCETQVVDYILQFVRPEDESLRGPSSITALEAAVAANKLPAHLVGTIFRKGPPHIWNIWVAFRIIEAAIKVNNDATLDIVKAVVEPLVEAEPYDGPIYSTFNGRWKCSPSIFYSVLKRGMWDLAELFVERGGKEEFIKMVLPELGEGPGRGRAVKDIMIGIGKEEFARRIEMLEQRRREPDWRNDPDWRNRGDSWC